MYGCEISLENRFYPIMLLLHLIGMQTLPCPEHLKKNNFCLIIWHLPKYLYNCIEILSLVLQCTVTILLPERKTAIALLCMLLLQVSAKSSARRSRKQFRQLLKKLNCSQILHLGEERQTFKISPFLYCLIMIQFNVSYVILHFISNERTVFTRAILSSQFISPGLEEYFVLLFDWTVITVTFVFGITFTSLSAFYGFTCYYLQLLFNAFTTHVSSLSKEFDYRLIIRHYLDLSSVMESLDDYFCYTAFVNVVFSMFGLFWINFSLMSAPKEGYLDYICPFNGEMFYLSSIGMIVLSGSAANEAFSKAKEAVLSLPGKVPQHYKNLKIILRSECKRDIKLTLWKTYTIHRSLFISTIGTLVTYGILVATLGTVNSK
ncbi:uncharacterized protein TNCT_695821 [Trichonephila clavata]|uniref:Gustatory receptor n=1 Tax=Trichonephila clavata TaxID=2740835 RepID=A0A8X6GZ14_TRICU|nr:uncharacterized protein TNCT_695821 [Trichonephila clavata]